MKQVNLAKYEATHFRYAAEGKVATITLNRPDKKNPLTFDSYAELGGLFRKRFMDINVSLPLNDALDLCWRTLAECFEPQELLMKEALVQKYYPHNGKPATAAASKS